MTFANLLLIIVYNIQHSCKFIAWLLTAFKSIVVNFMLTLSIRTSGEVAQLLLDNGADPNLKGIDGLTPVLKTVVARNIKILKVLVNHPKTDIHKEVHKKFIL